MNASENQINLYKERGILNSKFFRFKLNKENIKVEQTTKLVVNI